MKITSVEQANKSGLKVIDSIIAHNEAIHERQKELRQSAYEFNKQADEKEAQNLSDWLATQRDKKMEHFQAFVTRQNEVIHEDHEEDPIQKRINRFIYRELGFSAKPNNHCGEMSWAIKQLGLVDRQTRRKASLTSAEAEALGRRTIRRTDKKWFT